MKKSDYISELLDWTIKSEQSGLSEDQKRQCDLNIFELNFIIEHWKEDRDGKA